MTKVLATVLAVFVLIAAAARGPAVAENGPTAVIEALYRALLETWKQSNTLDTQARFDKLAPVVGATYDFQRMIGIIAGPSWTSGHAAARQAVVEAFGRFSVANYASRFKGYSGEQFEILGERPGVRDLVVVETRLIRSDGPPVSINYVFEQRDGTWRVIDVLAERAISELALRRSEYAQTLKDGGLAALTAVLNIKTGEMLAQ